MAKRRGQSKLVRAREWPSGLSDAKLAEFVATHDLSELIGAGRSAKVESFHVRRPCKLSDPERESDEGLW